MWNASSRHLLIFLFYLLVTFSLSVLSSVELLAFFVSCEIFVFIKVVKIILFFFKSFFDLPFKSTRNWVFSVCYVLSFLFTYRYAYPFDPTSFVEKTILVALQLHFCQTGGCVCVGLFLIVLCSVSPLVCPWPVPVILIILAPW